MAGPQPQPLSRDDLQKCKRPEIQALCKANNLRAVGTTDSMINSLVSYLNVAPEASPPKPTSTLRRVSSALTPGKLSVRSSRNSLRGGGTPAADATPKPADQTPKPTNNKLANHASTLSRKKTTASRSRVSSASSASPMTTDTDATSITIPTSVDTQRLAPKPPRISTTSPAATTKPLPRTSSLKPVVRERELAVKSRIVPKASSESLAVPGRPSRVAPPSNPSSPLKKPSGATVRRSAAPTSSNQDKPTTAQTFAALQSQIDTLKTSLAAATESQTALQAKNAECLERITQLGDRMDVRDDVINSQHDLIKALQQTLRDTHALLISTRQDVLQECRVDIASCASQVFGLDSNVNELQKRVAALEREQLTKEQRFESLAKEIGDVDVAMASERDRVSAMDQRITDLVVRVEEVAGLESANSLPLDGVRSKRRSLVGPVPNRQRQVSTDETSPTDSTAAGFTRDRRLSRASISASIHAVPASAPAHGPTSSNSVNFPTHAPPKGPAFNGMKQDFRFPPRATRHSITTFGHTTASNSVTSASPDSEPETTPEMTRTNTRRSTYDHSGEPEDPIERVTSSEDESSKPEPEPPRLRKRTLTAKRRSPPAIMINSKKPREDDEEQRGLKVAADVRSTSVSDLDVVIVRRSGEEDESLMDMPQPSFGFLPTDDEDASSFGVVKGEGREMFKTLRAGGGGTRRR